MFAIKRHPSTETRATAPRPRLRPRPIRRVNPLWHRLATHTANRIQPKPESGAPRKTEKKPLAGMRYAAAGSTAEARKLAEAAGATGKRYWTGFAKAFRGADLLLFSGHGGYGDRSLGKLELRKLAGRTGYPAKRVKLIIGSNCNLVAMGDELHKLFPNATVLGWLGYGLAYQGGIIPKFIERLPKNFNLSAPTSSQEIIKLWKSYVDKAAKMKMCRHSKSKKRVYCAGYYGYMGKDGRMYYYQWWGKRPVWRFWGGPGKPGKWVPKTGRMRYSAPRPH